MMYKHPGPHFLHNDWFDYIVVPAHGIDDALAEGWHLTTMEAKAAALTESDSAPSNDVAKQEMEPEKQRKVKFSELSELEKQSIKLDERSMIILAEIHNTTYHTIRKIKGLT